MHTKLKWVLHLGKTSILNLKKTSWHRGHCCCSCRRGETMSLGCCHQWAYCLSPRWHMSMEHWCNDTDRWKLKNSERNLPNATLFTTNHTWTDLGAKSGLRSDRPTTNRPSHGTAWHREFWTCIWVAPGSYLSWSLVTLSKFWGFPQYCHNSTTKRPYSLLYSFQTT
jgi:hypothetical protein